MKLFKNTGKISLLIYILLAVSLALFALLPMEADYSFRHGGDTAGIELIYPTGRWRLDWGMPLWPVLTEVVSKGLSKPFHCPPELLVSVLFVPALAVVVDSISGVAGVFLLSLVAWFSTDSMSGLFPDFTETRAYCILTALAIAYLILWIRKPGRVSAFLAGTAIAASLMFKSPLFFLPPLVCLYMLLCVKEADKKQLVIFLCASYSFSIVWALMQLSVSGHLLFTEWHRSDANIVAGALGLTGTTEGDICNFAGLPPGVSVLPWAAHEVLSHPLRYCAAVGRRIELVFLFNPLYWLFGLAGLWVNRHKREWQFLFLFCAYFLLLHCSMPVESRYLQPLLPLLLAAGCGIFADMPFLKGFCVPPPWSGKLAAVVFIALSPLLLYTTALVAAYPVRLKYSRGTIKQYLLRTPDNYLMLCLRAQELRDEGTAQENLEVWEKLYRLNRFNLYNEYVLEGYSLALELTGKPYAMSAGKLEESTIGFHFLRMMDALRLGKDTLAVKEYNEALRAVGYRHGIFRGTEFVWDRQLYSKFIALGRQGCMEGVNGWMQKMRREQRLAVILKMNRAGIDCSLYAYSWAVDCENKMPGPALELVNIALKNQPRNAVYIAERGIIQAKLGNSKNALSDINAALSLEPDYYPAHVDKGAVLADYFGDTRAACGEYRRGLALCLANRNQDCGGIKIIMSEIPNCR